MQPSLLAALPFEGERYEQMDDDMTKIVQMLQ